MADTLSKTGLVTWLQPSKKPVSRTPHNSYAFQRGNSIQITELGAIYE